MKSALRYIYVKAKQEFQCEETEKTGIAQGRGLGTDDSVGSSAFANI